MSLKRSEQGKLLAALLIFGLAGFSFYRSYRNRAPSEGKAFFYDLGAKKLFVAPHSSVPPIKGVEGEEEDGVRAIVVTAADGQDGQRIAWLETYTPELKRQIEMRKSGNTSLEEAAPTTIRRGEAHGFILVKRLEESDWHPMNSPEGEMILKTLNLPGPDGKKPVVCVP